MDHIVINVHPFIMRQELYVYRDGECIAHEDCPLEDVGKVCFSLCQEYNIHQVDYTGAYQFGQKVEEQLIAYSYNNFEINFNYY